MFKERGDDRRQAPQAGLFKPAVALAKLAQDRLENARAKAAAAGQPQLRQERRKVNVAVPIEHRSGRDQRKCPDCGSAMRQAVENSPNGSLTRIYCTRCAYKSESRQVDYERLRILLGFQATLMGTAEEPWLEVSPEFLQVAHLKPGDTLFFEPIYAPGHGETFRWVLKAGHE